MPWSSLFQSVERLSAEQGLEDWYARLLTRLGDTPQPFELALVGGLLAATPGWRFSPAIRRRCACCGRRRPGRQARCA